MIVVGHSFAGTVITEAGTHPNVVGLAYTSVRRFGGGRVSVIGGPVKGGHDQPAERGQVVPAFLDEHGRA